MNATSSLADNNNSSSTSSFSSFLKLKWRTSNKDTKLSIRQRLPNTVDDIERDWARHCALKLAFESDFKAPVQRLLQAGGCEVLDIGCGSGFWTSDMASQYPLSYFTGIDIDKNILPISSLSKNIVYHRIDLIELPLPYEDATFDYIFIRSMMDTLPDSMWDNILKDLIRIMKKGAYIECIEAYDNLLDAGPSMSLLNQCNLHHPSTDEQPKLNPWPNRIANQSQLKGMQIYHTHTPVGLYGGAIGSLLLEYWERIIKGLQRDWLTNKWITEDELEQTIKSMRNEVDEYHTYMSWYSVFAQKKGYNGPIIQFDDVDDFGHVYTTIIS
ncbi:S-adenosyl-L-methionine-dependent methyltransferase [Cokeromyces recurvatus]|uniref:S-adenosyl-L-methionine-dependent methyltransferase n=1 Tax=Cokeromyces recurvatus TaxID=90255 RepID=UPI00221FF42F|nr:S-adenosyl-L-methionine-dependent methyltransferase [Cokeromyces recurvatus]KAI7904618.1 S-adenosyl-L-methionine-dependent methyltransferase [Cokeromyces recurvatus]